MLFEQYPGVIGSNSIFSDKNIIENWPSFSQIHNPLCNSYLDNYLLLIKLRQRLIGSGLFNHFGDSDFSTWVFSADFIS